MQKPIFQLKAEVFDAQTPNYFTLSGPWLKIFGIYPGDGESIQITDQNWTTCELQTQGYNYINVHTNFGRSVYSQNSSDRGLIPTNILWSLPVHVHPTEVMYFTNYSNAGKIPFQQPIFEEVYMHFTDQWGDTVFDLNNYVIVIAIDYVSKQTVTTRPSMLLSRQQMIE